MIEGLCNWGHNHGFNHKIYWVKKKYKNIQKLYGQKKQFFFWGRGGPMGSQKLASALGRSKMIKHAGTTPKNRIIDD